MNRRSFFRILLVAPLLRMFPSLRPPDVPVLEAIEPAVELKGLLGFQYCCVPSHPGNFMGISRATWPGAAPRPISAKPFRLPFRYSHANDGRT